MTKRLAALAAVASMTLFPSAAALASEPGGPAPGPQDLGLESIAVTSTTLLEPKTGKVLVSGTVTCSEPLQVLLHSSVRQSPGRAPRVVEASGGSQVTCDGETPFAVAVSPHRGRLKPGGAIAFAAAFTGDPQTAFDAVEAGPVGTTLTR